jgi:acyl-CoA dehydrogenase
MFGALGVSQDTPLAGMYMAQRTLRLADGPDEVHRMVVGRNELKPYMAEATS